MAQIIQAGQINVAALQVAGVYLQIVPPQLIINGVATNVAGLVGSAAWGPVNAPAVVSGYPNYSAQFGDMVPRKYDAGTHIWNAYQQGNQVIFQMVRVTDGTDTAASATIQGNTATSKFTGSRGNQQQVTIGNGSAANSIRVTVLTPGVLPEVFDNILQGVQTLSPTPGTGFTSVPALSLPAPQTPGGIPAQASASLVTIGTPTVGAGGTGFNPGDTLTLPNGAVVKVSTVSSGAITSFVAQGGAGTSVGSITSGAVPTNPVAMISTSGAGSGATVNLTWGLGPATIFNPGSGYTTNPVPVLTGGGGTGGAYAASIAYWPNIANAINLGQGILRGPSNYVVWTNGTGTAVPTLATYSLAGGTDGATGVTGNTLVGVDGSTRTGMYALRGIGCSIIDLADCDTTSTFPAQISFGLSEGSYMIGVTPSGDTISNAATELTTVGVDSYAMKVMFGDWCFINDTINNQTRLTSPQGFVVGVLGNLAPNQSTLNKKINGIVGTQKSQTGVAYSQGAGGDLYSLALARMDVIANPSPGGAYFACQNGRNTSSNPTIRGDNYTRMTNFLAATLATGMGIYVGTLGTPGQARRLKSTLDAFMTNVQTARLIGDPDNPAGPQPWLTTVNTALISQGIEQASLQNNYKANTEIIVISIQGGQSVTIQRTTTPAALAA